MKLIKRSVFVLIAVLLALQLVPYGRDHTNPATTREPAWSSPAVRALAQRACFDCHSNETVWPWYAQIAPVSWLVQNDVDEGREHWNISESERARNAGDEAAEELESGEMPPWFYLPLHARARLNAAEKAELVAGLRATFGGEPRASGRERD